MKWSLDGQPVELPDHGDLRPMQHGDRLRIAGATAAVRRQGKSVWIAWNGGAWKLDPIRAGGQASAESTHDTRAPMPGRVVETLVAVGDRVEAGQPLVVIEAMKMQHACSAPHAGEVTELPFSAGEQVAEGDLLAHVEPLD